jgi:hypothetical protein
MILSRSGIAGLQHMAHCLLRKNSLRTNTSVVESAGNLRQLRRLSGSTAEKKTSTTTCQAATEEKVVGSAGVTMSDVAIFVAVFGASTAFLYEETKGKLAFSMPLCLIDKRTNANFCTYFRPSSFGTKEEEKGSGGNQGLSSLLSCR